MAEQYTFEPDYTVAPGATLKETLEVKGISHADFAVRTGLAKKTISQIINGIAPITYETAERFEMALGIPAHFWNKRELTYRESLARIEADKRLATETEWLDEVPVNVLTDRGFIKGDTDSASLVRLVLQFFGVSSVEAWREAWGKPVAQFRSAKTVDRRPGYVAAWLRMGEIQADGIETAPFDADEFRRALSDVRGMTALSASRWAKEMPERCAAAGVAVVFTKEIPSASVSGATRWLTKDKALIQLSLKFKSDDQIWFTFGHEAGHVLHHSKKQTFVEFGMNGETEEERQANEFARNWLIPPSQAHRLPYLKNRSQITEFAKLIGVSPGIVVGRLQYDKLAYPSAFNDLKRKLTWSS